MIKKTITAERVKKAIELHGPIQFVSVDSRVSMSTLQRALKGNPPTQRGVVEKLESYLDRLAL